MKKKNNWKNIIACVSIIFILFTFINFNYSSHNFMMKHSDVKMQESMKSDVSYLKSKLIDDGRYKCCLKNPCSYCLLKDNIESNSDKLVCECLEDIMNGEHPCGECIGEILEGHGNPYIAEYFATAIAEKTGNLDAIQKIIFEKYGTPIEKQI